MRPDHLERAGLIAFQVPGSLAAVVEERLSAMVHESLRRGIHPDVPLAVYIKRIALSAYLQGFGDAYYHLTKDEPS